MQYVDLNRHLAKAWPRQPGESLSMFTRRLDLDSVQFDNFVKSG